MLIAWIVSTLLFVSGMASIGHSRTLGNRQSSTGVPGPNRVRFFENFGFLLILSAGVWAYVMSGGDGDNHDSELEGHSHAESRHSKERERPQEPREYRGMRQTGTM